MNLFKTSALSAVSVLVRILVMLGLNKVLAIYVGPGGYALIGQFQNFIQMVLSVSGGAVNTGITKYTSQYYDNEPKRVSFWRAGMTITLLASGITAVAVALMSDYLAIYLLHDVNFSGVFIWLSITLVLFALNNYLLAVLNGRKEVIRYVLCSVAGNIFSLIITFVLVVKFSIYGAFVALATYQSVTVFITIFLCCKSKWLSYDNFIGSADIGSFKALGLYAVMALTSAICVPLSHIFIRGFLGANFGLVSAGMWEALWRLSATYLMVITSTLAVYYLPRLSELKSNEEIKNEIIKILKIIFPLVMAMGVVLYLLRVLVITILFSKSFLPMEELMGWQLVGDTLKVASWILGFVLTAKALWKQYIVTEVLFSFSFYFLVVFFQPLGLKGAVVAHAVNYSLHLLAMFLILRKERIL